MFADYTKLVLLDYEKKKEENALPSTLSLPTTAKLRDACLEACPKRYKPKDVRILNDIFGEADDQKMMLKQIEKYDADKLKPLLNFISRKTKKPDTRVIELLAWLIDFEPRPFELGRHYPLPETIAGELETIEEVNEEEENDATPLDGTVPEEEQPKTADTELVQTDPGTVENPGGPTTPGPAASVETEKNDEGKETNAVPGETDQIGEAPANPDMIIKPQDSVGGEGPDQPAPVHDPQAPESDREPPAGPTGQEPGVPPPGFKFKRLVALLSVMVLALTGFLVYRNGKNNTAPEPIPMGQVLPATNACMYWLGDHYEPIPCRGTTGDTLVEPLDPEKIRSFKKITRPDTITPQSKRSVWYVKINKGKEIEFYTSDGFHPIYRQLRLKPVTDYIIAKHIHPEQGQNAGN